MSVNLKNVRTGEVKVLDAESDEYFDLTAQVFDPGDGTSRPAWEQQGFHSRDNSPGTSLPIDSGLRTDGPEREPHKALTAGEIEAGIKDWGQKEGELAEQAEADVAHALGRRIVPGDAGEFSPGEGDQAGDAGGSGSGTPAREDVTNAQSSRRSSRKGNGSSSGSGSSSGGSNS